MVSLLTGNFHKLVFHKALYYDLHFIWYIYINDLLQGLISHVKLLADDASLISIVGYVKGSALVVNSNLLRMQDWAYQWKMSFDPDWDKRLYFWERLIRLLIHLFTLTMQQLNSRIHRSFLAFSLIANCNILTIKSATYQKVSHFFVIACYFTMPKLIDYLWISLFMTNRSIRNVQKIELQYNMALAK